MHTIPKKLQAWSEQPGAVLGTEERDFVEAMLEAAQKGVGFGFMQQVAEWAWQEACEQAGLPSSAWGPEFFGADRQRLNAANEALLSACEAMLANVDGYAALGGEVKAPKALELIARMRAAVAKAKGEL